MQPHLKRWGSFHIQIKKGRYQDEQEIHLTHPVNAFGSADAHLDDADKRFAAPASDIPAEMLDNVFLDALEYTGYKVQAQRDDGTIFKKYSGGATAYLSKISYGLNKYGTETVAKSGTATGLAPDIAGFESSGLCCASFVSYVYYNYLPNIAGIDTSSATRPYNLRTATAYNAAADAWVSAGTARRISFSQNANGNNFIPSEDIPIGSLIILSTSRPGTLPM